MVSKPVFARVLAVVGVIFAPAGKVLPACDFFGGFVLERVEKFRVQKASRSLFAPSFVIDPVQAARQQHVGGTDIGELAVPFHQGNFVQRGCLVGRILKIGAGARTTLDPEVAVLVVFGDRVICGIEPRCLFKRIVALAVRLRRQRAARIEIEQERAKGTDIGLIKPPTQCGERARVTKRIDEEFVGIERQRPVAMPVAKFEPVQPIRAKPAFAVPRIGMPQRHIGLVRQIFGPAIGRAVVHEQEMIDPKGAVIVEEIRQTGFFVADRQKGKNGVRADLRRAIGNRRQFTTLANSADLPFPAFDPEF